MARWKARGRLPIGDNWTFFASYHGWGTMSRYWSKFRCLKGDGSLWTQISGGKGRPPPTIFGIRKLESLRYRMVEKIAENFYRLSRAHQRHRRQTDWQTERRRHLANVNASSRPLKTQVIKTRPKLIDAVCKIWSSLHFDVTRNLRAFILRLLHSTMYNIVWQKAVTPCGCEWIGPISTCI